MTGHTLETSVLLATLLGSMLPAQAARPTEVQEAQVAAKAANVLCTFARTAESNKQPSRAHDAYRLVLAQYDDQNKAARVGLGFRLVDGTWQAPTDPATPPADTATARQKSTVETAWRSCTKQLGKLHRELGFALWKSDEAAARRHLERGLRLDPDDARSHELLGHEEVNGFRGDAQQIAFVRRLLAIRQQAATAREQEFEVRDLPASEMPKELQATGLPFAGARSQRFTYWVVESPEAARAAVLWAERAFALLQFLFGDDSPGRLQPSLQWNCVVRTDAQRDTLLQSGAAMRGKLSAEEARAFGGLVFDVRNGQASWSMYDVAHDADMAVGHATKRCCRRINPALSEGLVHAMTWLLCGTTRCRFGTIPKTYSGTFELPPSDPEKWLERLQDLIDTGEAWPLVQLPRERLDGFRDDVRLEVWSFVLWLLARHPSDWQELVLQLNKNDMLPETAAAAFQTALGRDVAEVEAEWHEWARRGSPIGKATRLR